MDDFLWFLLAVFLLTSLTYLLAGFFKIDLRFRPYQSISRALIQLVLIALVLRGIISMPWTAPLFIALMLTMASFTSGRHARQLFRGQLAAALGICSGSLVTISLVFALQMMSFTTQNLLAMGGIIIGGTMTITTLTARHFVSQCKSRSPEIEGWWSLGASSPIAFSDIRRESIKEALTPGLDQTAATGLVTLPGTFVGALLGGIHPLEAAQMQLAVLAGQSLSGLISALIFTAMITRSPQLPALKD